MTHVVPISGPVNAVLTLCAAVWLSLTAAAADIASLGPAVGDPVPLRIEASDANGTLRTLDDVAGEKGTILVFFRSADWCPFCQRQLMDLRKIDYAVEKKGYKLVGISYDEPETLKKFAALRDVHFTLLSDPYSIIIDRFGIRNDAYQPGHYAHGVPHPMIFIVSKDGIIQGKLARESYRDRPEPETLLRLVDAIAAGKLG